MSEQLEFLGEIEKDSEKLLTQSNSYTITIGIMFAISLFSICIEWTEFGIGIMMGAVFYSLGMICKLLANIHQTQLLKVRKELEDKEPIK